MRYFGSLILFYLLSSTAFAGFHSFTMHSRASCGNNETISWHFGHSYDLWTASNHIDAKSGSILHAVTTGWEHTWRSAAVHWGEGTSGWNVLGYHWTLDQNGNEVRIGAEYVSDCSIYDGWWDN